MIYFLFQAAVLSIAILNYVYWGGNTSVGMFAIGWCSSMTLGAVARAIAKERRA